MPGRGFLLNNEMTDFDFAPPTPASYDPNLPAPGKRPRSSMTPTIVLKNGKFDFAVGSPGGSTIITTVLQILVNHIDFGMTLPDGDLGASGVAAQRRRPAMPSSCSTTARPAKHSRRYGENF